jgi:hypothetical protein
MPNKTVYISLHRLTNKLKWNHLCNFLFAKLSLYVILPPSMFEVENKSNIFFRNVRITPKEYTTQVTKRRDISDYQSVEYEYEYDCLLGR